MRAMRAANVAGAGLHCCGQNVCLDAHKRLRAGDVGYICVTAVALGSCGLILETYRNESERHSAPQGQQFVCGAGR